MPNIHHEYHFAEGHSPFPSNTNKAIAIMDYSFFFIASNNEKIEYALHAGLKGDNLKGNIKELKEYLENKFGESLLNDCKVQILSNKFTLIPKGLFTQSDYPSALDNIYPDQQNTNIIESEIPSINSILISDGDSPIHQAEKDILSFHNKEDFTAAWLKKIIATNQSGCYVHILSQSFLIAILFDGKLQLFNRFDFAAKSDFLYFLLGSIQCTNLKNEETNIFLSGEITAASPLMEQLDYYFAEVRFLFEKLPHEESRKISHQFYTLI